MPAGLAFSELRPNILAVSRKYLRHSASYKGKKNDADISALAVKSYGYLEFAINHESWA